MAVKDKHIRLLIVAIATRVKTARELADQFGYEVYELREFTEEYRHQIEEARWEMESEAKKLADKFLADQQEELLAEARALQELNLWITSKEERLRRYQQVADGLLKAIENGSWDATTLREARSYMAYVANEMGQIPQRGVNRADGDEGTDVSYNINGIDMEMLK